MEAFKKGVENFPLTQGNSDWKLKIKMPDTKEAALHFICIIVFMRTRANSRRSIKDSTVKDDLQLALFKSLPMFIGQKMDDTFLRKNAASICANSHHYLYLASSVIEYMKSDGKIDSISQLQQYSLCLEPDVFLANMNALRGMFSQEGSNATEKDIDVLTNQVLAPLEKGCYAKPVVGACGDILSVALDAVSRVYGSRFGVYNYCSEFKDYYTNSCLPWSASAFECASALYADVEVIAIFRESPSCGNKLVIVNSQMKGKFAKGLNDLFDFAVKDLLRYITNLPDEFFASLYSNLFCLAEGDIIPLYKASIFGEAVDNISIPLLAQQMHDSFQVLPKFGFRQALIYTDRVKMQALLRAFLKKGDLKDFPPCASDESSLSPLGLLKLEPLTDKDSILSVISAVHKRRDVIDLTSESFASDASGKEDKPGSLLDLAIPKVHDAFSLAKSLLAYLKVKNIEDCLKQIEECCVCNFLDNLRRLTSTSTVPNIGFLIDIMMCQYKQKVYIGECSTIASMISQASSSDTIDNGDKALLSMLVRPGDAYNQITKARSKVAKSALRATTSTRAAARKHINQWTHQLVFGILNILLRDHSSEIIECQCTVSTLESSEIDAELYYKLPPNCRIFVDLVSTAFLYHCAKHNYNYGICLLESSSNLERMTDEAFLLQPDVIMQRLISTRDFLALYLAHAEAKVKRSEEEGVDDCYYTQAADIAMVFQQMATSKGSLEEGDPKAFSFEDRHIAESVVPKELNAGRPAAATVHIGPGASSTAHVGGSSGSNSGAHVDGSSGSNSGAHVDGSSDSSSSDSSSSDSSESSGEPIQERTRSANKIPLSSTRTQARTQVRKKAQARRRAKTHKARNSSSMSELTNAKGLTSKRKRSCSGSSIDSGSSGITPRHKQKVSSAPFDVSNDLPSRVLSFLRDSQLSQRVCKTIDAFPLVSSDVSIDESGIVNVRMYKLFKEVLDFSASKDNVYADLIKFLHDSIDNVELSIYNSLDESTSGKSVGTKVFVPLDPLHHTVTDNNCHMDICRALSPLKEKIGGWLIGWFARNSFAFEDFTLCDWTFIGSKKGDQTQQLHCDYDVSDDSALWDVCFVDAIKWAKTSFSAIIALEDDTCIRVLRNTKNGYVVRIVRMGKGDILLMMGTLFHGGSSYDCKKVRVHVHVEVFGMRKSPDLLFMKREFTESEESPFDRSPEDEPFCNRSLN